MRKYFIAMIIPLWIMAGSLAWMSYEQYKSNVSPTIEMGGTIVPFSSPDDPPEYNPPKDNGVNL